jgi:uncharacterized protein YdcH (DUF465 family)
MKAYQKRVVEEKNQLDDKIAKLTNFINTSEDYMELSSIEQERLREQLTVMQRYAEILSERIKYFKSL